MGKKSRFFKPALSPTQQVLAMANTYGGRFRVGYDRNHALNWTGVVWPCGLSSHYEVQITYPYGRRPVVWVKNPRIQHFENGKKVPHTFSDGSICLHVHEDWEPWISIAATLVPWLSLWLYHYEVWQATGQWLGGGHDIGSSDDKREQRGRKKDKA